jgi:hypothetical protein
VLLAVLVTMLTPERPIVLYIAMQFLHGPPVSVKLLSVGLRLWAVLAMLLNVRLQLLSVLLDLGLQLLRLQLIFLDIGVCPGLWFSRRWILRLGKSRSPANHQQTGERPGQ